MAKKDKTATPSTLINSGEIGSTGTSITSGYIFDEYNPKLQFPQSVRVFDEMRKSDASVAASLRVIKLPITSATYFFEPASDSEQDMAIVKHLEHEFFEKNNFYSKFLPQALLFLDFGFMIFEKVWEIEAKGEYKGMISLKKLAPRLPKSVDQWIESESGEAGVRQSGWRMDKYIQAEIPAHKVLRLTFDQEGSNYEGVSVLRPAYKHWFMKSTLEKIGAIAADRQANGTPTIKRTVDTPPTEAERAANEEFLRNISANAQAYLDLGFGNEFEFVTAANGYDIMPLLTHHDRQIGKAVLAQFLDTGAQGNKGGNAQNGSQQDLFLKAIESIAYYICDRLNDLVIKEFVAMNYGDEVNPPLLNVRDIKPKNKTEMAGILNGLIHSGALTADLSVENMVREDLGLPLLEERPEVEVEKVLSLCDHDQCSHTIDKKKIITLADGEEVYRELTEAEKKLDIKRIRLQLDANESSLKKTGGAYAEQALVSTLAAAEQFFEGKKFEPTPTPKTEARAELIALETEQYEFFKAETVKEIGETRRPATPPETKAIIRDSADLFLESIENDFYKEAKSTVISAKQKGFDWVASAAALIAALEVIKSRQIDAYAGLQSSGMMNKAISEVYQAFPNKVAMEQFSAILDDKTSPMCLSLDGRVDKVGNLPKPPLHGGCRSRIVSILVDQDPKPLLNPAPKSIVDRINPNPFKTVQPKTPVIKKNSPAAKQVAKNKN